MDQAKVLLQVRNLKKYFSTAKGFFSHNTAVLKAVDDITLTIHKGETLGLIGESGCGKTTLGRTIVKLYKPTDGEIIFDNNNITNVSEKAMFQYRKRMQMIFQDPYSSLNSRMTVGDIIGEPLDIHNITKGKARQEIIQELLKKVGLNSEHANRYPHEFSGGQRQRIGIARALAVQPDFIVCDEPISALDVSIQAQVVNLLEDLQRELGIAYLFITHDLSMAKQISQRVGVMYLGKLVELASSFELYSRPLHPYSKALIAAISIPDPGLITPKNKILLKGDVPSPINPPSGCYFRTRCIFAQDICTEQAPEFRQVETNRYVACHLVSSMV